MVKSTGFFLHARIPNKAGSLSGGEKTVKGTVSGVGAPGGVASKLSACTKQHASYSACNHNTESCLAKLSFALFGRGVPGSSCTLLGASSKDPS